MHLVATDLKIFINWLTK